MVLCVLMRMTNMVMPKVTGVKMHHVDHGRIFDVRCRMPLDTFGARVRHAMEVRGVGFNELDRLLEKSQGYTSKLVKRDGQPRAGVVAALVKALDVRPEFLLHGEEPMEPGTTRIFIPDHLEEDEDTRNTIRYAIETEKLSEEAVNRVLSRVPGGASGRMPPAILLDQIRAAHNAIKYEQSVGDEEAMRQRGEKVVTDELDPPLTDDALAAIKAKAAKKRREK